ncbi:MAG TPA: family 78 glycoside hydrolase catalytic domain [bacterium]|nr:family 78 glycoside hydrolase catalytic domain [bacterium]
MKAKLLLLLSLLLSLSCSLFEKKLGAPVNLRCEYRTNPLGVSGERPRLFWQINDPRRGARQTAYQIQVASTRERLERNEPDIWDTGKEESDQNVHISYDGSLLESGRRYFWRVRTWDQQGEMSAFSKTAFFETALFFPHDWEEVKWIGKIEKREKPEQPAMGAWIWHPSNRQINLPIYFRRSFQLPQSANKALLRIAADNIFRVFLNGAEIGKGAGYHKLHEYDVLAQLHAGANSLAVEAINTAGDICGLIATLEITLADGSQQFLFTDRSWKCSDQAAGDWKIAPAQDRTWSACREIESWGGGIWGKPGESAQPLRAILARKEFDIDHYFDQARVYVTGLGSYVLYINGKRVGDERLTPGWTDYPKRIHYQTYDVTRLLRKGSNAVAAMVGNAWWSGGMGGGNRRAYSEGPLRLLCKIKIEFPDGRTQSVVSDESWQVHEAPILFDNIYDGEVYDARLEQAGWNEPSFKNADWEPAVIVPADSAVVCSQEGPPIRTSRELTPIAVTEPAPGVYVFDMGQNMAGNARLSVKGPAGQRVELSFAEVLNPDGTLYKDNYRSAKATDTYILKGKGKEVYQPTFTYRGFRYVQVAGYPGKPGLDAITGCVFNSDATETGVFTCSNELINRIQHNISWGLTGNLHSVPTDCPQRDERLGWMGDAQVIAPTACFNRDMADFFRKWMQDIADCQGADGAVRDVNPCLDRYSVASPAWGDAVVIIPWVVYQYYGDRRIIEQYYPNMAAWVEYMKNHSQDDLYERDGYGDWVSLTASPKKPIAAAYYYRDVTLMSQMAKIIGKEADVAAYAELARKIAAAFNKKYYRPADGWYEGKTQTANLLPLAFGLVPQQQIAAVIRNIAEDVRGRDTHLSTGFIGTSVILPMLSRYGYHDLAYQLASQKTFPSWGYMVEKGATTIWELWNSDTEGPGMNSRNHFAFGAVGRWFYDYLAGLRVDIQHPGYKRAIIAPQPVGDLKWAEAKLNTLYGPLSCRWQQETNTLKMWLTIPANTTAEIHFPTGGQQEPTLLEGGRHLIHKGKAASAIPGLKFVRLGKEAAVLEAEAGTYELVRVD